MNKTVGFSFSTGKARAPTRSAMPPSLLAVYGAQWLHGETIASGVSFCLFPPNDASWCLTSLD
jgi:hypothetical protein